VLVMAALLKHHREREREGSRRRGFLLAFGVWSFGLVPLAANVLIGGRMPTEAVALLLLGAIPLGEFALAWPRAFLPPLEWARATFLDDPARVDDDRDSDPDPHPGSGSVELVDIERQQRRPLIASPASLAAAGAAAAPRRAEPDG
jgi:hypothetical protein